MDPKLSKVLREFMTGPLHQLLTNFEGKDGAEWQRQFSKFLRKEPCWTDWSASEVTAPELDSRRFVPKGTIAICERPPFEPSAKFVVDTGFMSPLRISYIGPKFKGYFLSTKGGFRDASRTGTLRYSMLRKPSGNRAILQSLGGESYAETILAEVYGLLKRQGGGRPGVLLVSGHANVFYIRDLDGVLRAVQVFWDDDGWNVDVRLDDTEQNVRIWSSGSLVFSRTSVLQPMTPVDATA